MTVTLGILVNLAERRIPGIPRAHREIMHIGTVRREKRYRDELRIYFSSLVFLIHTIVIKTSWTYSIIEYHP